MRTILLATGNPGKAREMREILEGIENGQTQAARRAGETGSQSAIEWRYLSEFADCGWPEPVEDGPTFAANAVIKARHYARLSGLWTIADDSGLVVDALGGDPGVRSARYAGEPKDDKANNALLVRNLAGVPAERRTARFRCVVVLAGVCDDLPGGASGPQVANSAADNQAVQGEPRVLAMAEGTVEGRIIDDPRGSHGFGYDPHFWHPAFGMTTAEMPPETKHSISHRGQALRRLREQLAGLL
jgi:XTP/dITP diphosphohydrolase